MFYNLSAELARKNLSLKQVANNLNMVYDTLLNKVNGRTEFTRKEMFLIKKTFFPDMSVDYLFGVDDTKSA